METHYDTEEDILSIQLDDKEYWKSVELSDGVVIDISKDGTIIAIEIPNARKVFSGDSKKVLQKAQTVSV